MTTTDTTITRRAAAKINLTLHVTGQRDDGYHLLDSLVLFTDLGDIITVAPADDLALLIDGPFAKDLSADGDNLVLRAARLFNSDKGAKIILTKNLPVASGIGGGSADAAATMHALAALWNLPFPNTQAQLSLGADIPVCVSTDLTRMRGIGETLDTFGPPPILDVLLVNPMVGVSTAKVFNQLSSKTNAGMTDMPDPFDTQVWLAWLANQRNDLEQPARIIAPEIDIVITALSVQDGCHVARMSGSGATCFALFDGPDARDAAAAAIRTNYPDWWVAETDEAST